MAMHIKLHIHVEDEVVSLSFFFFFSFPCLTLLSLIASKYFYSHAPAVQRSWCLLMSSSHWRHASNRIWDDLRTLSRLISCRGRLQQERLRLKTSVCEGVTQPKAVQHKQSSFLFLLLFKGVLFVSVGSKFCLCSVCMSFYFWFVFGSFSLYMSKPFPNTKKCRIFKFPCVFWWPK